MNENRREHLKEKIKIRTELFRVLLVSALATISGIVSLFYSGSNSFRKLFTLGFFGAIAFVFQIGAIYYLWTEINKFINELNS